MIWWRSEPMDYCRAMDMSEGSFWAFCVVFLLFFFIFVMYWRVTVTDTCGGSLSRSLFELTDWTTSFFLVFSPLFLLHFSVVWVGCKGWGKTRFVLVRILDKELTTTCFTTASTSCRFGLIDASLYPFSLTVSVSTSNSEVLTTGFPEY